MMTWSINWDAVASCNGAYSYAANYQIIFGNPTSANMTSHSSHYVLSPNPVTNKLRLSRKEKNSEKLHVFMTDLSGQVLMQTGSDHVYLDLDVETLTPGTYFLRVNEEVIRFQK
jgi:chitinase